MAFLYTILLELYIASELYVCLMQLHKTASVWTWCGVQVEVCRLANLPDLDQSNSFVGSTLKSWVNAVVKNYSFDGLRCDTTPEVLYVRTYQETVVHFDFVISLMIHLSSVVLLFKLIDIRRCNIR